MLKSVDILIGLSVVMLVVSMAVTLLSQGMLNLLASRGRNLRIGLADLLELLDVRLSRDQADAIAAKILSQRIIGGRCRCRLPAWLQFFQFGEVIHREEFIKILLDLAASYDEAIKTEFEAIRARIANKTINVSQAAEALDASLRLYPQFYKNLDIGPLITKIKKEKAARRKKQGYQKLEKIVSSQIDLFDSLKSVLRDNGIDDPATTLKNVRMLALEFEKSNPELADNVREANALLQAASSDFLAKIFLNFDHSIDRVSVRFTATTRVVSVISAALVAIALQLDTVYLINRLAMDEQMRTAFVEAAPTLAGEPTVKAASGFSANHQTEPAGDIEQTDGSAGDAKPGLETQKYYLNFLAEQGLISLATDVDAWCRHWRVVSVPGLILSIFLLSLGGPFWYNALGKLLQLRSGLARKDEEQKTIRQTTQSVAGGSQG